MGEPGTTHKPERHASRSRPWWSGASAVRCRGVRESPVSVRESAQQTYPPGMSRDTSRAEPSSARSATGNAPPRPLSPLPARWISACDTERIGGGDRCDAAPMTRSDQASWRTVRSAGRRDSARGKQLAGSAGSGQAHCDSVPAPCNSVPAPCDSTRDISTPDNSARAQEDSAPAWSDPTQPQCNSLTAQGVPPRASHNSTPSQPDSLRAQCTSTRGRHQVARAPTGTSIRFGASVPCAANPAPEGRSSPVELVGSALAAQGNSAFIGHRDARKSHCLMKLEAIRQNVDGCIVWKSQSSTTSCAVVTIRSISKSCRVAAPLDSTASMTNATAVSREYAVFLWPLRADGVLIFVPFAGLSTSAAAAIPSRAPESGWFIRTPLTFGGGGPTATSAFGSTIRPPLVVPCKALRD